MRYLRFIGGGLALVLLLAACGQMAEVGPTSGPTAIASSPTSRLASVDPVIIPGENPGGNRTCEEVGAFFDTTFAFSSDRINYEGGSFDAAFPAGLSVSTDGTFVSFSSSFAIGAVIVKGANAANVYYYDPAVLADEGLSSPDTPGPVSNIAGLSNITFCWNETPDDEPELKPLKVSKTAYTKHRQGWDWEIDKVAKQDYVYLGDAADFAVYLTPSGPASHFEVWGVITVYNPNDEAAVEVTGVSDVLSFDGLADLALDVECTVDFDVPHTLAAGDSFTCSYAYSGTDKPTKNTATATVAESSDVEGGSGSVTIEFASNWSEIEAGTDYGTTNFCVDVVDNLGDASLHLQEDFTWLARVCVYPKDAQAKVAEGVTHGVDGDTQVLYYSIPTYAPLTASAAIGDEYEDVNDVAPRCDEGYTLENRAKVLVFGGVGYHDAFASVDVVGGCKLVDDCDECEVYEEYDDKFSVAAAD